MKAIRVKYQVLEAVLDLRTAKDNPVLVHPEEDWRASCPVGGDNRRNLVASDTNTSGDIDQVLASCDIVLDRTYHTKAFNQAMMETFRTYTELDPYGRLHVVSSTQIVFHVRRILSHALGIPKSRIRVEKPRIGGGFGAKQTAVCEVYPAFVTLKTGRPAKLIYTREEAQTAGSPRHEMQIRVRLGADREGRIRGIDLYTLSNSGAYGEHGPTTVGLSGHKSIPLYSGYLEAYRFSYDVVYTNTQAAGAYRGYGATQGIYALETTVNELAERLGLDPTRIRDRNMVREGMQMPALLQRDGQRLRPGPLHGALPSDVPLGRKVPRAGHGQRQSPGSRRGHGHAGLLHLQRGCGLCHPQTERGRHLQPDHRRRRYGHRL